jgi:hypothetical protein
MDRRSFLKNSVVGMSVGTIATNGSNATANSQTKSSNCITVATLTLDRFSAGSIDEMAKQSLISNESVS